eukprot:superscaffoldBa00005303_g20166
MAAPSGTKRSGVRCAESGHQLPAIIIILLCFKYLVPTSPLCQIVDSVTLILGLTHASDSLLFYPEPAQYHLSSPKPCGLTLPCFALPNPLLYPAQLPQILAAIPQPPPTPHRFLLAQPWSPPGLKDSADSFSTTS